MARRNVLALLLKLVFVAAFNASFFVVNGTRNPASVWLCYAFLHFSYFMLCATPLFGARGKSRYIMNAVLYAVSGVYFVVELLFGIVAMFINLLPLKLVLVLQIVLTALYLVILLINLLANDTTENYRA